MKRKRVMSGIQPTGTMHLGNYFGAVRNWVELQDNPAFECVFGVVDLHAMTMPYDPAVLREATVTMLAELLACGLDPAKCVLFVQSLVPQHAELAWVLGCVTSYGDLQRMTQFKEKSEAAGKYVSAGLFTYPVLQAADILIYKAELVPVGRDQVQHLELSRSAASRFNQMFGETFPEPQPLLTAVPKLLSLADPTKKMSKSLGDKHVIGLFESEASIRKKVKSAVTDSGDGTPSPGVENLLTLLKSCGGAAAEFEAARAAGTLRYADLKSATADAIVTLTRGMIERKTELLKDKAQLLAMVQAMSRRACEWAEATMADVRRVTGLFIA